MTSVNAELYHALFDRREEESRLATESEAMREYAWNVGAERPDRAWILTNYDVWVANPHYVGPIVPHPESYEAEGL